MGKLTIATAALVMTFGAASVNAEQYTAADNSAESELCVAAATNSRIAMHSKVKDFRPAAVSSSNYKLIANEVYCNGVNIAQFAEEAGNTAVANKLAKYRSGNVEILDIAKQRNGHVHIGSK